MPVQLMKPGDVSVIPFGPKGMPKITVCGGDLPQAWELAILACWDHGIRIPTEYDVHDRSRDDPPSADAMVTVCVVDPFAEPRIHKNFPGGPAELEIYRQEIVLGIHDHWAHPGDPDGWIYTYHGRVTAYQATEDLDDPDAAKLLPVNQIDYVLRKLREAPYSRRVQVTTWIPNADPKHFDPPCLQRMWFRIAIDEGGQAWLNTHVFFRSRDGYKAWFMNAFAITDWVRVIAEELTRIMGRLVRVGPYVDVSDSFHLYGSYFGEFGPEYEKMRAEPDYTKRSWSSDHPAVAMMFEETQAKLAEDPDFMKSK